MTLSTNGPYRTGATRSASPRIALLCVAGAAIALSPSTSSGQGLLGPSQNDPRSGASQFVSVGRPSVAWRTLGSGDASGSGAADSTGALAVEPLRLELFGRHATPTHGCGDQMAEAATGMSTMRSMTLTGFSIGGASSWRTPRLSLFGFSRFGCVLDAAVGAGVTFTVPVHREIFLSLSGGALYLPATSPGISNGAGGPASSASVHVDVVLRRPDGNAFTVGVATATRGLTFGGLW